MLHCNFSLIPDTRYCHHCPRDTVINAFILIYIVTTPFVIDTDTFIDITIVTNSIVTDIDILR